MSYWDSTYESYIESLESRDQLRLIYGATINLDPKLKVSFAYQQLYFDKYLPTLDLSPSKSVEASTTYQNLGDEAFNRDTTNVDALKYYTKSIAWAPPDSEQLAVAYGKRSTILLTMSRHRSSLLDINRALALPSPMDLREQLISYKNECVRIMKEIQSDTEVLLDSLSELSIGDTWVRNALENGYKSCEVDEDSTEVDYELRIPLPPATLNNKVILRASAKIKMACNEKLGRHFIATETLAPGDVVVIDKPFACVLLPEAHYSHCSNCHVRCEMLIPCTGCSTIMFCGQKCLEEALNQYHRVECEVLQNAIALKLSKTALLALRILMVATEQGRTLKSLMIHPTYGYPFSKRPFDANKVYDSSQYDSVQDLVDHLDRKDKRYQLYRCCLAAVIVHMLKYSTYFKQASSTCTEERPLPGGVLNELEVFAGTLLLKYLYVIESNAHAISETVERKPNTAKRSLSIGIGLYPLISMGNHTCDSNVLRLNHRNIMVFYALGQILPGEQLTDNYGIHFTTHNLEERREFIQNFLFECDCNACRFNWALYDDLPTDAKCLSEMVDKEALQKSTELFESWLLDPKQANIEDEFKFLCDYLVLLRHSVEPPYKTYFECQEALRQMILLRTNYYSYCTDLIVD